MKEQLFELMLQEQQKQGIQQVVACNDKTSEYGLMLSEEEARELMICRSDTLQESRRVEFGGGVLPKIITAFCDSQFISQDNYMETLIELQEIFYMYKNESQDELADEELLSFMRTQFEEVCFGDLEYLSGTCLERFCRALRSGYKSKAHFDFRDEYSLRDLENEYGAFDEEARWDFELYKTKLSEND